MCLTAVVSLAFFAVHATGLVLQPLWASDHIENFQTLDHKKWFSSWQTHHDKTYASKEEEIHRFNTFVENWKRINEFNKKSLQSDVSSPQSRVLLTVNHFADLNSEEFRDLIHGKQGSCLLRPSPNGINKKNEMPNYAKLHDVTPPKEMDWRSKGVVAPVKNQGQCGSCWAFSTIGALESAIAIETGKLTQLSEQQLIDCSKDYGNMGCEGGLMDNGFKYFETHGICSEDSYPYNGKENKVCSASNCTVVAHNITKYFDVIPDNSTQLEVALTLGPVSVAIEADEFTFQFYKQGILSGDCGSNLDHGVVAVGYGTENGDDYWIIRNSWGPQWGDKGYIRLCRNCHKNKGKGECGVLEQPSYPQV